MSPHISMWKDELDCFVAELSEVVHKEYAARGLCDLRVG